MTTDVASYFATARRVADVNCIFEIERFDKRCEIVGIRVHVVSMKWLTRSAVTSTVVTDASIALRGQKEHLVFKGISRQRPTVTEDNGLTGAPIFVVNLGSIFCSDSAH